MAIVLDFTETGEKKVSAYIRELEAKRKAILDARLDTDFETIIPTKGDILQDILFFEEGDEYCNSWGVTDNYNGDYPLLLKRGEDYDDFCVL